MTRARYTSEGGLLQIRDRGLCQSADARVGITIGMGIAALEWSARLRVIGPDKCLFRCAGYVGG